MSIVQYGDKDGQKYCRGIRRGMVFLADVRTVGETAYLVVSNNELHGFAFSTMAVPLVNEKAQPDFFRNHRVRLLTTHFVPLLEPGGSGAAHPSMAGNKIAYTDLLRSVPVAFIKGQPIATVSDSGLAMVEAGFRYALDIL